MRYGCVRDSHRLNVGEPVGIRQSRKNLLAKRSVIAKTIRYLDMFSGMGGFREGLTRAGDFACVGHCEIETEFDNALMREDGLDPIKFFTASHIKPSRERAEVIAPFYEGVTVDETLAAMKGMITVHHLLQAANPVKRWVVLTGMRVAGKYEFMHGLVANPQPNPKCVQSSQKLEELYKAAVPLAVRLIEEYAENKPLGAEYQHTFGEN